VARGAAPFNLALRPWFRGLWADLERTLDDARFAAVAPDPPLYRPRFEAPGHRAEAA